jgi:hypothetical protein
VAQKRSISPDAGRSHKVRDLGALPNGEFAVILWSLLQCHCDDGGRWCFDREDLRWSVMPAWERYSHDDFWRALEQIAEVGLVTLYRVNGRYHIDYHGFAEYQTQIKAANRVTHLPGPEEAEWVYRPTPKQSAQERDNTAQERDDARENRAPVPVPVPVPVPIPDAPGANAPSASSPSADEPGGASAKPEVGAQPEGTAAEFRLWLDAFNRLAIAKGLRTRPWLPTKDLMAKWATRRKLWKADELARAAQGMLADPYMCGDNDGHRIYATPEFVLRNERNVQKYLDGPAAPAISPNGVTGAGLAGHDPPGRAVASAPPPGRADPPEAYGRPAKGVRW